MYVPFHTSDENFDKYFSFKAAPKFHKIYRSINLKISAQKNN